jgi:hypothetical protein
VGEIENYSKLMPRGHFFPHAIPIIFTSCDDTDVVVSYPSKEVIMAKQIKKSRPANPKEAPVKRAPEAARRTNGEADASPGVENLDKVRDILFGSQMRDNERRFGRLEERLAKDAGDLRDETRKRLDSLEAFVRKEVQSLLERLKAEQAQRNEGDKELATELKDAAKALQARATELADAAAEAQRELRQEILDQSKVLRDELQAARVDTAAELENTAAELRSQKLDKAALSDLFTEMAARLSEQE